MVLLAASLVTCAICYKKGARAFNAHAPFLFTVLLFDYFTKSFAFSGVTLT